MARELQVWGTTISRRREDNLEVIYGPIEHHRVQVRAVVATRTKKEACAKFGITQGEMNNYASPTSNPKEVETALANPGQVFARPLDGPHHDKPLVPISREAHVPMKRKKRQPYVVSEPLPVFTKEELEMIVDRFQMANDPTGQALAAKAQKMINHILEKKENS